MTAFALCIVYNVRDVHVRQKSVCWRWETCFFFTHVTSTLDLASTFLLYYYHILPDQEENHNNQLMKRFLLRATSRCRAAHGKNNIVLRARMLNLSSTNHGINPIEVAAEASTDTDMSKKNISLVPYISIPLVCNQTYSLCEASSAAVSSLTNASSLSPTLVAFLQFAPPLACQAVFLSPMTTMKQFAKDGTTGDVSCIPYAAMCANGVLWMMYGAVKGDVTIIAPNITGILFGAYYVKTFATYAPSGVSMTPYYAGIAALSGSVTAAAAFLDTAVAIDVIGLTGCAVVAVMFGGPLGSIKTVLKDKNTNSLPMHFTAASTVNCLCWVSYGALVIDDIYVWGPNLAGLIACFAQIGLYAKFGLPKGKK